MYQYKREPLTNEEANQLANAAQTPIEKLIIYTLLDTGIRVSELANLKKENILWQDKRLIIYGKGGPYGKKSKRRVVQLTERAFTLISHWFSISDTIGRKKRAIQKTVDRVAQRAGIFKKVSPHVLRHTFAVTCIKRGISTRALQQFLGHDHLATTEIYLNLSPEDACREFTTKF